MVLEMSIDCELRWITVSEMDPSLQIDHESRFS